jgi:7-cyano-7-deazaguanine synthase in queuosine biosynthesis
VTTFELRPTTSDSQVPGAEALLWPGPAKHPGAIVGDLDPWLARFGAVPARALDLARIAVGVFAADQSVHRGAAYSRTFELWVHLLEPEAYTPEILAELADFLASLSGDTWTLGVLRDTSTPPPPEEPVGREPVERVALLSGGLDSFAGAVLSSASPTSTAYLGHWHQSPVKSAQNAIGTWFTDAGRPIEYHLVRLGLGAKADSTTRTRAFLFMALGIALATARGASVLEVPENGYTSINPPLGEERGGVLTTRSTHPRTISSLNSLLSSLGIDVAVSNPHALQTKGDLVRAAAAASPGDFAAAASRTYSCAKPPQGFTGADPNGHCGVCVACIVRRGAFLAAGVVDATTYAFNTVAGPARDKFERERSRDAAAVRRAILTGFDEIDLLAIGPFPDDFDLDSGLDLCRRGLAEMALVRL